MDERTQVMRLRVVAELDSDALIRTLERFQNKGLRPRRVLAEYTSAKTLTIQVDVSGLDESFLTQIANKLTQYPSVLQADWHYP